MAPFYCKGFVGPFDCEIKPVECKLVIAILNQVYTFAWRISKQLMQLKTSRDFFHCICLIYEGPGGDLSTVFGLFKKLVG